MHITSVEIENIKSIQKLRWEVPAGQEAGWHVIIGDNGSGKTVFLKSIALALVGNVEKILSGDEANWIRSGSKIGKINIKVSCNSKKVIDESRIYLEVRSDGVTDVSNRDKLGFSCSFGASRRFTGGLIFGKNKESNTDPDITPHLSLFIEYIALGDGVAWLNRLKEESASGRKLLDDVHSFINQDGFLPYGVQIVKESTKEILFKDANGHKVSVFNLSEGYRSVLSFTFELLLQIASRYQRLDPSYNIFTKRESIQVNEPGVVLIDEVDAHLHPTWQRRIGQWFRKYFPNMQFIVTTHSPLICQAAEHGTVFRLPRPGTDETGRMIVGDELNRLVYGNVLDAYGTELFGENVTRSESSEKKLQQLAELNRKELRKGLTERERKKQQSLRRMLPTTAYETNGVKE